jgi:excisionase family DNA binding protein
MKRNSHDRAYMTPNEVAELLMVSPVTVRQWAQKDWIPATTPAGGHRRFLREDVERFARERGMELASDGITRILVVDDNRSFAHYLADLLANQAEPIETHTAHDGFDAGLKVLQFSPDIVLLDLKMPGMDGFSVCQHLKDDESTRHIRVIAMTGYYTPENEARILNAGAEACLAKPFDKDVLLSVIGIDRTKGQDSYVLGKGMDQHAM